MDSSSEDENASSTYSYPTFSPTIESTTGSSNATPGFNPLGLIVLLVVALALLALLIVLCCCRNRNRRMRRVQALLNAGNRHKFEQQWLEAAEAFHTAAQLSQGQPRGEHDAANNFAEAANCHRKLPEYIDKAVTCLETAARIYAEIGQFSIAARHLEDAGDLTAKAKGDVASSREAIRLYQQAADYWSSEDSPASAADSRGKAAHIMADIGMLAEAARVFEDLGVSAQGHSLLGFGAKDHMLKSCLCQLCLAASRCPELADELARKCDSFADSDERSLVMKLSAACDAGDVGAFDSAVTEFERLNNLDDWSRRRLAMAKQSVERLDLQ